MEEDETLIELEALRFTYADDLTVLQEHPLSVKIAIAPYTGARTHSAYLKTFQI